MKLLFKDFDIVTWGIIDSCDQSAKVIVTIFDYKTCKRLQYSFVGR